MKDSRWFYSIRIRSIENVRHCKTLVNVFYTKIESINGQLKYPFKISQDNMGP